MARVRFNDQWFDEIDAKTFYEAGFEAVILQNAHLLRQNAFLTPFKTVVEASGERLSIPDLALIDAEYRFWWIIEVELNNHSLKQHVLPQVGTFIDGDYNWRHVDALLGDSRLDGDRLEAMLKGDPPKVVVISNEYDDAWKRELDPLGVAYAVFRIFRSSELRDIVYFEGDLPNFATEHVTRLTPTLIPRHMRIASPGALPAGLEPLMLLFEGKQTIWKRVETKTDCYLAPSSNNPLTKDGGYLITRDDEGRLHLNAEKRPKP